MSSRGTVEVRNNVVRYALALGLVLFSAQGFAYQRNVNMDVGWKFQLGDDAAYIRPNYNDRQWRQLNLPHDWSIEGEYNESHPAGRRGGYLPTGIAWYRKHIKFQPAWKDKRVILRFDGVYLNSDVWVNGMHVGHRPNGYVSFEYDITGFLQKNGKTFQNTVIAVRVDHALAPSGRWYTGSGIYRHVWLDVVEPIHIPNDGIFFRTKTVNFNNNDAVVVIDTEVKGANNVKALTLEQSLLNNDGKIVAKKTSNINVKGTSERAKISHTFDIKKAKLWSTDTPYRYTLQTSILKDGHEIDKVNTRVGIRTIAYHVDRGFLLNNRPVKLEGMSFHHDAGPVGAAVPDDVWRRRLRQLKTMGMNALRPAHTPFSPFFYDLADEMGFMVMNEIFDGWETEKAAFDYGIHFEQWWQTDLAAVIKRDRNHPSVVMWSLGNEVRDATDATQKKLVDFLKTLDNTRPVTQGRGYYLGHLDIDGFNGHGEYKGYLERHHARHPKKTLVGTEITHTLQTRGIYKTKTWYRDKTNKKRWKSIKNKVNYTPDLTEEELFPNENPRYNSSYDNAYVRMNVRDELKMARRLPYLLGTFRWTAFDYLGESRGWPARTANFGVIDLGGFEKDAYYLYQSQWSDKPMVHMLPHWTHPGKEGVAIPVVVYTNLDDAELFLNGQSLGKKTMTDDLQILWMVPYQAGELKVVASKGAITQTKTIYTAGNASAIKLSADRKQLAANRTDVVHIAVDIVDDQGHFVPRADNLVNLSLSGPGKIIGADNGDIFDLTHHIATQRKVFNGKLMVLVQASDKQGDIALTVSGKSLKSQTFTISSR